MKTIAKFIVQWLVAAPVALLGVPAAILLCSTHTVNGIWFLPMILGWMMITGPLLSLADKFDDDGTLEDSLQG